MSCSGIRKKSVINIVLFITMVVPTAGQSPKSNEKSKNHITGYGTNGDLYDIFKDRLERIQNELTYHKLNEKLRHQNKNNSIKMISELQNQSSVPYQYEPGTGGDNRKLRNRRHRINNKLYTRRAQSSDRSGGNYFKWLQRTNRINTINNHPKKITKTKRGEFSVFDLDIAPMIYTKNSDSDIDAMSNSLCDEYCQQLNAIDYKPEKRNHCQANDFTNDYVRNWLDYKDYGNDLPLQHNTEYVHSNLHRRNTENNTNPNMTGNSSSSLYPSVLAKALEISLNPNISANSARGNLLANLAQKMNTSTLDLAEKLTKTTSLNATSAVDNNRFNKMLQSHIMANDPTNKPSPNFIVPTSQHVHANISDTAPKLSESDASALGMTATNVIEVLDRVLSKLEKLHDSQNREDENHPDGTPCDIVGSWSSSTLGLSFSIQLTKDPAHEVSAAEVNNRMLSIEVLECIPPKHHSVVDLEWKFAGSALKQIGGPFYMYSQKRSEHLSGTFLGFCRTCGGIDTIFGSWTFLSPSKDCVDCSLAFDVKRDMLLRNRMEMKRKERFKDLLYQSRIGKSKNLKYS